MKSRRVASVGIAWPSPCVQHSRISFEVNLCEKFFNGHAPFFLVTVLTRHTEIFPACMASTARLRDFMVNRAILSRDKRLAIVAPEALLLGERVNLLIGFKFVVDEFFHCAE